MKFKTYILYCLRPVDTASVGRICQLAVSAERTHRSNISVRTDAYQLGRLVHCRTDRHQITSFYLHRTAVALVECVIVIH